MMRITFSPLKSVAAVAAILSVATVVRATPIGLNISEAGDFNLLTWGNATLLNSDTEGRVAVGGNASFSSYSIGGSANISDPTDAAFVVGGNLTAGHGSVAKGSIHIGGSYSGPGYNLNTAAGSNTVWGLGKSNVGFDFAAAQTALSARSTAYGAEAETGTSDMQYSTLNLTGLDPFLNIFSITASELAAASTLNIFVPNMAKALINVSGSVIEFKNKGIGGTLTAENTLFNMHEANELNMEGIGIIGSILAPFANVNFKNGQMNGQLIANSFQGAPWGVGEMHNYSFDNDEPGGNANVPDGGRSLPLLVTAIVALFVTHRLLASARSAA